MTWSARCLQCDWTTTGPVEDVDRETRRHSGDGKMRGAMHHATEMEGVTDGDPADRRVP